MSQGYNTVDVWSFNDYSLCNSDTALGTIQGRRYVGLAGPQVLSESKLKISSSSQVKLRKAMPCTAKSHKEPAHLDLSEAGNISPHAAS